MAIFLLNNKKFSKEGKKSVEIFGLPKSGKTTLLNSLEKSGKQIIHWENIPITKKLLLFFIYFIKNSWNTLYLFYKTNTNWIKMKNLGIRDYIMILIMRNSYIISALGKYEEIKKYKTNVYTDEFLLQSIFMIFQIKKSKEQIIRIINKLPISNEILLIEVPQKLRYKRWQKIKITALNLNPEYRMLWWRNMEENYKFIKDYLNENYNKKILKNP